jgi:hypothetical protein
VGEFDDAGSVTFSVVIRTPALISSPNRFSKDWFSVDSAISIREVGVLSLLLKN